MSPSDMIAGKKLGVVTVKVSLDMAEALKEFTRRTKIPQAEVVRVGIALALEKYSSHQEGGSFP